jgi:hypothetical protein
LQFQVKFNQISFAAGDLGSKGRGGGSGGGDAGAVTLVAAMIGWDGGEASTGSQASAVEDGVVLRAASGRGQGGVMGVGGQGLVAGGRGPWGLGRLGVKGDEAMVRAASRADDGSGWGGVAGAGDRG